jgi:hypothetical protein
MKKKPSSAARMRQKVTGAAKRRTATQTKRPAAKQAARAIVRRAIEMDTGARIPTVNVSLHEIDAKYATVGGRQKLARTIAAAALERGTSFRLAKADLRSAQTAREIAERMVIIQASYRCPRGDYERPVAGKCPTHRIALVRTA